MRKEDGDDTEDIVYKEDGDDTDDGDGDGDAMEMVSRKNLKYETQSIFTFRLQLLQGEIEKKFWRMP